MPPALMLKIPPQLVQLTEDITIAMYITNFIPTCPYGQLHIARHNYCMLIYTTVANHNCGVLIGLLCCVDKPLRSMTLKGCLPV